MHENQKIFGPNVLIYPGRIRLCYYDTSGPLVFVRFLEEIDDPKKPFEINRPLASFITAS